MSRLFIAFAAVAALAVTFAGIKPTSASAQTAPTPTPTASPMSTMKP